MFMRLFAWLVFLSATPGLIGRAGAQDSLSYSTNLLTTTAATSASATTASLPSKWRLSGYAGYVHLYQQDYLDKSLYLTHGLHASLAADYFVGRHWGLGVMIGYQSLAVSDEYRNDPSIPRYPTPLILPLTAFHSFMLTFGPAISLPLGRRFSLAINLRGGWFYNDAPVLGAYLFYSPPGGLITGELATSITPSDQRTRWGFHGLAGPKYEITPKLSLGLVASGSYTSVKYTRLQSENFFTQNKLKLGMYGVQLAISYRFAPTSAARPKAAPAVPPSPVCYPPLLDPAQRDRYEAGATGRPLFKWRSSAPVYTEGERYTFRLYTLPGNKLLYEQVVSEPQVTWPAKLALPDSNSVYFYSLHTSRSDDFGQSCRSEPVVGTLVFVKPQSDGANTPNEPVVPNGLTVELYEVQARSPAVNPSSPAGGRAPNRQPAGTAKRPTAHPSTAPVRQGDRPYYRATVFEPDGFWPLNAPLPIKVTVFRYVIRRDDTHALVNSVLLLAGPDGSVAVITDDEMKQFFEKSVRPADGAKTRPVGPSPR